MRGQHVRVHACNEHVRVSVCARTLCTAPLRHCSKLPFNMGPVLKSEWLVHTYEGIEAMEQQEVFPTNITI